MRGSFKFAGENRAWPVRKFYSLTNSNHPRQPGTCGRHPPNSLERVADARGMDPSPFEPTTAHINLLTWGRSNEARLPLRLSFMLRVAAVKPGFVTSSNGTCTKRESSHGLEERSRTFDLSFNPRIDGYEPVKPRVAEHSFRDYPCQEQPLFDTLTSLYL